MMLRKKLRKILRRLAVWALADNKPAANESKPAVIYDYEPTLRYPDIGLQGRHVIIKSIKSAKINREL